MTLKRKKLEKTFVTFDQTKGFLYTTPKTHAIKEKIGELELIKIKTIFKKFKVTAFQKQPFKKKKTSKRPETMYMQNTYT